MKLRFGCVVIGFLSFVLSLSAQTASSAGPSSNVPPLIPFSSVAADEGGSSLSGVVNITFSLYAGQRDAAPLWTETQNNVQLDPTGHYSVQLGITKSNGVPTTLFTSGEARWLGVKIAEQAEQPRVLLLSVPYALKAADAQTLGGLPASAFVLAGPVAGGSGSSAENIGSSGSSAIPSTSSTVTTSGGTVNTFALFSTATDIENSLLTQTGTTAINVNGKLNLAPTGTATASKGFNSTSNNYTASVFNSSSGLAVNEKFLFQTEPVSNNTSTPSGSLHLLFGSGSGAPVETGIKIASNGLITFAPGQTFPGGGGSGTVTSVATGVGLKGGPITSTGTLTIDTTVVPRLGAINTFTANQTLNGTLTATSSSTGNVISGTATSATSNAVYGDVTAASGTGAGVYGNSTSPFGNGVIGNVTATTGFPVGVEGFTVAPAGIGTLGQNTASSGVGVYGSATDPIGTNYAPAGIAVGVFGRTSSPGGDGVIGANAATTGNAPGVLGSSSSPAGFGVAGTVSAPNGAGVYAANNSPTGNAIGVFGSSVSAGGFGVEGTAPVGVYGVDSLGSGLGVLGQTSSGTGVQGQASSGVGVSGLSATGDGVYGQTTSPTNYGVVGENFGTSGNAVGVYGTTASSSGAGVYGAGFTGVYGTDTSAGGAGVGVYGTSPNGYGVYGVSADSGAGVYGSGNVAGVVGTGTFYGVLGQGAGFSSTGQTEPRTFGVWGDTGGPSGEYVGVFASADSNIALLAANNDSSGDNPAMVIENLTTQTHNPVFQTSSPNTYSGSRHCTIDTSANLTCTGVVSGIVQQVDGKQTAIYAMQSAENWLEDAGSGQLSNGSARIELDPGFAQTVNAGVEYHVFLTPNGDSRGLYVSHKTATSFEVHEQSGGASSIAFDYRIMAKRKGYETVRLEDVTERFKQRPLASRETNARMKSLRLSKPQSVPTMATPPTHPMIAPRPVPLTPKLLATTPPRIAQASRPAVPQIQK